MKTSFSKKLLACVLSLCMILTVCAGALSVSAAATTATVVIDTVEVEPGEQSVDVKITATAEDVIGGADLYVNVPEAANITKVQVTDGYNITFASNGTDVTATGGIASENTVDETDNVAQFVVLSSDSDSVANTLVVTLTFTGDFAEGTYAISLATGTLFGTYAEDTIEYTETAGAIVAKAAHTCTPADAVKENVVAATCTTAGSYDSVVYCSDCEKEISRSTVTVDALGHTDGEAVVENSVAATCTATGSYDSVIYCTVCSAETSRTTVTVPMTDHTPAEAVEENRKDATCTAAGSYDSVVYCSVEGCGAVISSETITLDQLAHNYTYTDNGDGTHSATCPNGCDGITNEEHTYTDGTCVCGAVEVTEIVPVEDSTIVVRDAKISITATLDMIIRVRKSVLPTDCVRAEIVVTPTIYDSSYNLTPADAVTQSYIVADVTGNNLIIEPKNFSLFALDLPLYIQIKCYDSNENYYKYSPTYTYYPVDALKDQYIASPSTESEIKLDTLITDTLNMSAAAQTYFAGNASAGAALKETVNAGNLVNKDWPQDYASITEPTYNTYTNVAYGDGFNSTDNELRISADLSGAPILTFTLRKATTAYPDTSKLAMTVSYTTYYAKADGGEVVSDTIEGDEWAQYASGKHYLYKFSDCAMYDGNKTITVVATYDGAEVVRAEYSLEAYIAANSTGDTDLAKCLKAMGIFGASARAYFSTLGTVDPA